MLQTVDMILFYLTIFTMLSTHCGQLVLVQGFGFLPPGVISDMESRLKVGHIHIDISYLNML